MGKRIEMQRSSYCYRRSRWRCATVRATVRCDAVRCAVRGAVRAQPHSGAKKFVTFGWWSKLSCPGGSVCCLDREIAI